MISDNDWGEINLGTVSSTLGTVKQIYEVEKEAIMQAPTDNLNISLMYLSDYGYAASPEQWLTNLNTYNNVINTNWVYTSVDELTIAYFIRNLFVSGTTVRIDGIMQIASTGEIVGANKNATSNFRPCFYLKPNVILVGGTGTQSDPYRLSL